MSCILIEIDISDIMSFNVKYFILLLVKNKFVLRLNTIF